MPYWKKGEVKTDRNGKPINPGDLLQHSPYDPDYPWQHFICYTDDCGETIQVRDLNANNVAMCSLGLDGDVENIGHYSQHPGVLDVDDLFYYFNVGPNKADAERYRFYVNNSHLPCFRYCCDMTPDEITETIDTEIAKEKP